MRFLSTTKKSYVFYINVDSQRCIFFQQRSWRRLRQTGITQGFVFRREPKELLLEIVYQTVRREIYAGPSTVLWVRSTLLCPLTSIRNRYCGWRSCSIVSLRVLASNFASFLEGGTILFFLLRVSTTGLTKTTSWQSMVSFGILWTRHYRCT